MTDQTTLEKLLRILRVGGSDVPAEADTALRKGIELMDARGITLEAFLDQLDTRSLPQEVCANLARRYYDSRGDIGPSGRERRYRKTFAVIARKYTPEEFTQPEKPAPKPQEPPKRPDEPRHEEPRKERGPDPDWVRKMEEMRRQSEDLQRRKGEQDRREEEWRRQEEERRREEEERRRKGEWANRFRWHFPTWQIPRFDIDTAFLSDAIRAPEKTIHLFVVCFIASLIPGIITGVVVAGVFWNYGIHVFNGLSWMTMLGVCMLPYMVRKGRGLWLCGWYYR